MKVELTGIAGHTIKVRFDTPQELSREFSRHLVSAQISLPFEPSHRVERGRTYTISLVLPNGKEIELEGHVLRKRNGKVLFSLTGITPDIENELRSAALSQAEAANPTDETEQLLAGYDSLKNADIQTFLSQVSLPELKFHAERLRSMCEALIAKGREADAAALLVQLGRFVETSEGERGQIISKQLSLCAKQEVLEALLGAALKVSHELMPTFAEAFSALGEPALPYLLKLLELSTDSRTRLRALDALIAAADSVKPLILSELSKPQEKWYYLRNLILIAGKIGAHEALPTIEKHLADENAAVRAEALAALVRIRGQSATNAIVGSLSDRSPTVVKTAVRLMGELGDIPEGARKFFVKLFSAKKIPDEELLIEALRTVAALGDRARFLEKPLIKLLDRFPPPGLLRRVLNTKDTRPVGVMLGLFAALGAIGTRRAIKALKKRLKQERDPWYESVIREELARAEAKRNAK